MVTNIQDITLVTWLPDEITNEQVETLTQLLEDNEYELDPDGSSTENAFNPMRSGYKRIAIIDYQLDELSAEAERLRLDEIVEKFLLEIGINIKVETSL